MSTGPGSDRAMRDVAVITDSTCDMPRDLMSENGVDVLGLKVSLQRETFLDGEISQEEFFRRMKAADDLPTTSQPSVGEFVELYGRTLESAHEIVSVHLPPTVSGTMESARQAAERFDGRVHVVDAHIWSGPLGLIALRAGELSARGASAGEIVADIESVRDRARIVIALDSLDNLAKGGRIGNATAFLGGLLDLRVVITIRDSMVQPVRRVRGARKAIQGGLDWFAEQIGETASGRFCVMHAMAQDRAEQIRDLVLERWGEVEVIMTRIGVVMSTHTGSGWGLAYLPLD